MPLILLEVDVTPRKTSRVSGQVKAENTAYLTVLTGQWLLLGGATSARVVSEMQQLVSNFRQKAQYRTAKVNRDYPDQWVLSATARTAVGVYPEDFSSIIAGRMWFQAGIAGSVSSGTGEALSAITGTCPSSAELVARGSVQLQPELNASSTAIYPIGRPFPCLGITGLLFGYVATGLPGSIVWRPKMRYLSRDDAPGAWSDVINAQTDITTASDTMDTADFTSLISGSDAYLQAGMQVTTSGQGNFEFHVAGRF